MTSPLKDSASKSQTKTPWKNFIPPSNPFENSKQNVIDEEPLDEDWVRPYNLNELNTDLLKTPTHQEGSFTARPRVSTSPIL